MGEVLTRKELAERLGVPESRLRYSPNSPRLNRKMRRKIVKMQRRMGKKLESRDG